MFSVSPLVINISPLAIDASNLFGSEAFNPLRQQRKERICVFMALSRAIGATMSVHRLSAKPCSYIIHLLDIQSLKYFVLFIGYIVTYLIIPGQGSESKQKQNHHKLCVVCYGDDPISKSNTIQITRFPPDRVSNRKINTSLMTPD